MRKNFKKNPLAWICTVFSIGLIMLFFLSACESISTEVVDTYAEAEALIAAGEFEQAKKLLEPIKEDNYKDTKSLIQLCKAHLEYDSGKSTAAYYSMLVVNFEYQSDEQLEEISTFKDTLQKEYDEYNAELEEKSKKAAENRIKNGVPYVGMSEALINHTSLGRPSDKVRHNYQVKNGQQYLANLYDFYQGGKKIFTARCVLGKVTEVWDMRDSQQTTSVPKKKPNSSSNSGPNVEGFSDPEDFYDEYWDDFFDYEDAEDYYYDHGGR